MNESTNDRTDLFEQASDWFLRVRAADASTEEHVAWLAWIEADPAHRRAFEEVQQLWVAVGEMDSPPWPRAEDLAPASPSVAWYSLAAAASIVAIVSILVFYGIRASWFGGDEHIATSKGEQQSVVLPDGSRIELGGATSVALDFTTERRLVIADEGEVFYRVKKDPARPFIVKAGPVSVTAVGTAFSVRREGETVSVVVAEGVVDVLGASEHATAVRARAGERVRYDHGALSPEPMPASSTLTNSWRRGQLRFEGEPLRVVVASLNRYSPREIVIADPALNDLQFTGAVFDDSVDDWLHGIQIVFPIKVDRTDPRRVTLSRRE